MQKPVKYGHFSAGKSFKDQRKQDTYLQPSPSLFIVNREVSQKWDYQIYIPGMLKGIFSLKTIEFRSRRDMRNHLVQPSHVKGDETQEVNNLPKIIQLLVARYNSQSNAVLPRCPLEISGVQEHWKFQSNKSHFSWSRDPYAVTC